MRSLSKHVYDIRSDDTIIDNDIIGFTQKTRINLSDCTCLIIETFHLFNINFDNNENKFLILGYGCRNDFAGSEKFVANVVSIFSFKKHTFADRAFTQMLFYQKAVLRDARIFSVDAIFTSSKFHRFNDRGPQL